ncbi:MAG: alpha/beta hydrolase [Gammaproteobacteria bacterium]
MNSLLSVLLLAVLLYGIMALYLFIMQPRLLYYPDMPSRRIEATPAAVGLNHETVSLLTADGVRLHGWFIPEPRTRATLLFCHGNAGNISHRLESIRLFHDLGLNILIFDYRGYGRSDGHPSEKGSYRDVDAGWDYLVDARRTDPGRIVVFGRSLGAAIAADIASRKKPAAVILESAFTSVPEMAATLYPWLPVRFLSRYRYDNKTKIRHISAPVLVVHGRDDEIVPFSQGRQLFELAGEPKHFLALDGGHNDAHLSSRPVYIRELKAFLGRYLTGG